MPENPGAPASNGAPVPARRERAGTLFGASMFGPESVGTPDARTIYYKYPTSGDGDGIEIGTRLKRGWILWRIFLCGALLYWW